MAAAVAVCQIELPLPGHADVTNDFLDPSSARSHASGNGGIEQGREFSRSKSRTKSRTKAEDAGPMPEISDRSRLGGKIARPAALDLGFKKESFRSFRPLSAMSHGARSPNSPGSPISPWSSASNWSPWMNAHQARVSFHIGAEGDDGDSSPRTPKLDSQDLLTRSVGFSLKKTPLADSTGSLPGRGGEEAAGKSPVPFGELSRVNSLPCLEGSGRKLKRPSRSLLSLVEDTDLEKSGLVTTGKPKLKGMARRLMMVRKMAG